MLAALGSLAGSVVSGLFGRSQANKNIKLQKQFAQNQIQWKVADAKKAGIHPLAALGAPTHSFNPVQGGDWSGLASAGQDLGRAMQSGSTQKERVDAFTRETQRLAIDKSRLENDILRTELASRVAKVKQAGTPPPVPDPNAEVLVPGQGSAPLVKVKPQEVTPAGRSRYEEPSSVVDRGYVQTEHGLYPVPGDNVKQKIEDNLPHEIMHFVRNNLYPMLRTDATPPSNNPPYGHQWHYHPIWGWQLRKKNMEYEHALKYHPARGAGRYADRRIYPW